MKERPLFSIVTVCMNVEATIEDTLKSVLTQVYRNYEYIVIDGKSTDRTFEIIEAYRSKLDLIISEPDKGIYDAMNKGISRAKGEYLLFLNSGDALYDSDVLYDVAGFAERKSWPATIFGDTALMSQGRLKKIQSRKKSDLIELFHLPVNHQSTFMKRSEVSEGYDLSFKILADYNQFMSVLLKRGSYVGYINRIISYYDAEGYSARNNSLILSEFDMVRNRHFNGFFGNVLLFVMRTKLRYLLNLPPFRWLLNRFLVLGRLNRAKIANVV